METNNQIKIEPNINNPERSGFYTKIMPVLSKDGGFVYFFVGKMIVTEHTNRFKGLLGIQYDSKPTIEKSNPTPRAGLHVKIELSLSKNKEWVTIYLPGNLGKICNHVNAYKHIFGVKYTKKPQFAA